MSDGIELFEYRGARVRTFAVDEPCLMTADICAILDLRDVSSALRMVDPEDVRRFRRSDTPQFFRGIAPQVQEFTAVTESGAYALIFQSRKSEARAFKRWVTQEVLPQIRRTGGYQVQAQPAIPQSFAAALRLAADEHERANLAEAKVAELEPVVAAVDVLTGNGDALKMGAVANMIGIGRNTLFDILRKEGVLQRDRRPYQRYVHWFEVVLSEHPDRDGNPVGHHTTYVWPAGAASIHAFLAKRGYPVKPLPGVTALPAPRNAS